MKCFREKEAPLSKEPWQREPGELRAANISVNRTHPIL